MSSSCFHNLISIWIISIYLIIYINVVSNRPPLVDRVLSECPRPGCCRCRHSGVHKLNNRQTGLGCRGWLEKLQVLMPQPQSDVAAAGKCAFWIFGNIYFYLFYLAQMNIKSFSIFHIIIWREYRYHFPWYKVFLF